MMKGVVFTAFLDYLDATRGPAFVEDMLTALDLPSGGAYTAVGTYGCEELLAMLDACAEHTAATRAEVARGFGRELFSVLARRFPDLVRRFATAAELMASLDEVIHPIVRRLYPEADLPTFTVVDAGAQGLTLAYASERRLDDLAHGLIEGCLAYYATAGSVRATAMPSGTSFRVDLQGAPCPTS